jgi:hypothetical protein
VTKSIVKRSSLLRDGRLDRLDAEYFDPQRREMEDILASAGGVPFREAVEIGEDRVDPKKGAGSEFDYVEIGGVDGRDGFVLSEKRLRAEAPSRARIPLKKGLTALSSVRPLRNQVFVTTEDLDGTVASTGFFLVRAQGDVKPQVVFAFLKTKHAIDQLDRRARASMYPSLAPHDVLDICFPSFSAEVLAEVCATIDKAADTRKLFLRAADALAKTLDAFFRRMGPSQLLADLRSRGQKSLTRASLVSTGFDRIDAEFHAPAFDAAFSRMKKTGDTVVLKDLLGEISTGESPPADQYVESDNGRTAVVLKQGCLTGLGVRWADVSFGPAKLLSVGHNRALDGDVVFTSTAHQPLYIGHRVDVVSGTPPGFKRRLTFNGDLMRIRLADQLGVPPAYLAAFLRCPLGKEQIRRCVRGVSSHVYAEDIREILMPLPTKKLAADVKRQSAEVERHRWRYMEIVRSAVDRLEAEIDSLL